MSDEVREECGVLGIFNGDHLIRNITMGLYALQHRGQESAGFAIANGERVRVRKSMGLVSHLVKEYNFDELSGHAVIGHVRYSTTGSSTLANAQPILVSCKWGHLAIVHNGNLTNTPEMRNEMENDGHIFLSSTDSEVLLHEIARTKAENVGEAIKIACARLSGSFCIIFLTKDAMYVARDGFGFRPMCLGKKGKSWVIASETCALDLLDADYVRDVNPGELITIDNEGMRTDTFITKPRKAHCIFEYVYFARPDSLIFGHSCDKIRRRIGRQLAKECPVSADIVIAVPDSSTTAALGYAQESKIPFEIGLLRNHYVGRTFIDPAQDVREQKVRLKFNTIDGVIKGRRVCVVEDSIVRGTTLKLICQMIRDAGATEVHIRISSPPVANPCFFGMDFPTSGELVASSLTPDEIGKMLGVDTLGYLSVDGLRGAAPGSPKDYCAACFDGVYPDYIPVDANKTKCG